MLIVDLFRWKSFGSGSTNIILAFHFEHLTSHIPGKDCDSSGGAKHGREEQMPDPVHEYVRQGSAVSDSESFHADNRNMELVHHKNNQDVSKKETGNGNQKIR